MAEEISVEVSAPREDFNPGDSRVTAKEFAIGIFGFIALLVLINIFNPTFAATIVTNIPYIVLVSIVLYAFMKIFVRMYGQTERGIVYRFGKFNRVAGPGWSVIIPFFENEFKKVDVRTKTEVINGATAITRDDIPLSFDLTFFYAIADPKKAILQVTAVDHAVKTFFQGLVRNSVGAFGMREVFSNMEEITLNMKTKSLTMLEQWGIILNAVEILKITLPETLLNALSEPITEEQKTLAARFQAEATRVTTEVLGDAAQRLNPNALTYLYMKALEKISSSENSKVVLPMSFPSIMGGLSAGVGFGMGMEANDQQKTIEQIAQKITAKN